MVGVISSQGTFLDAVLRKNRKPETMKENPYLETEYVAETRLSFGRGFQTRFLKELLETQLQKDRNAAELSRPSSPPVEDPKVSPGNHEN